jgi:hypothetical protein
MGVGVMKNEKVREGKKKKWKAGALIMSLASGRTDDPVPRQFARYKSARSKFMRILARIPQFPPEGTPTMALGISSYVQPTSRSHLPQQIGT